MELPLRLDYELTSDALREADRALVAAGCYDRHFVAGRRVRLLRQTMFAPVWFLATIGVFSMFARRLGGVGGEWFAFALLVGGVVPALTLVAESQVETFRRRMLRDAAADRTRGLACTGRIAVELRDSGVLYEDPWTRAEFAWPLVSSAVRVGGFVVLTMLSRRMVVIPLGALPPSVTPEELTQAAHGRHEAAGGAGPVILSHLEGTSRACPACGYDLKGVQTLACPECGRGFTVADL